MIRSFFQLDELKNWNHSLDDPETTILHGKIIKSKPFLKKLYNKWYSLFKKEAENLPEGILLEIGSGSGFIKEFIPTIITTDVLNLPNIDRIMSAEDMSFKDNELSGIFMIDVLHHIPTSELFFSEARRCLKPKGKVVMIEPANSWWGRFIFKNFHHEPFNPAGDWKIPSFGPLSGANGALPWIIFERDKVKFTSKFPELKIISIKYHTPLSYLLSGGVSMKALVPSWSFKIISLFEEVLQKISFGRFSMFMTIILEKTEG